MSENIKRPKVIVFDLDYTLWPFWIDTHVSPPFKTGKNGKIFDADEQVVHIYPDSGDILKKLHEEGYEIGIASRTSEIKGAYQLLKELDWEKYIKYSEIYPGSKITHIRRIKQSSGVDLKDIIFFDDEQRNINDLTAMGVLSILVKHGMTHKVLEEGLQKFAAKR